MSLVGGVFALIARVGGYGEVAQSGRSNRLKSGVSRVQIPLSPLFKHGAVVLTGTRLFCKQEFGVRFPVAPLATEQLPQVERLR